MEDDHDKIHGLMIMIECPRGLHAVPGVVSGRSIATAHTKFENEINKFHEEQEGSRVRV